VLTGSGPDDSGDGGRSLGFLRVASIVWPLWVAPIVIIGGLILAQYAPDWFESFYTDKALPFLITYWIGLGFTTTWRLLRESARAQNTPAGVVAAVGVLSALVLVYMLGGVRVLWEDPWIFGVAVAPGFALARPFLARLVVGHRSEPAASAGASPSPERSD
jgi:hypothetical protein